MGVGGGFLVGLDDRVAGGWFSGRLENGGEGVCVCGGGGPKGDFEVRRLYD